MRCPGSTFGKKTQARTLSKEDQSKHDRAVEPRVPGIGPEPSPRSAEGVSGWRS